MKLALLLLASTLDGAAAAVAADEVDGPSLPGYGRPLPGRHYSGYVTTPYPGRPGVVVHTHYYLALHADEDAPLVQWQQGGPGGSSLIGMYTEMGPLTLNDYSFAAGAGAPRVFDNARGWQNVTGGASLLFLEHPAPTGFSSCEPPGACGHDDDSQADLHVAVLEAFFGDLFPELRGRRYVMAGESYAGVLVPTVALKLLAARTAANAATAPYSLEGFALGNSCPGNRVYTCTPYSGWAGTQVSLDFLHGHGMIPDAAKRAIDAACADWYVAAPPGPQAPPPPACAAALEDPVRPAMSVAGDTYEMGGGYFLYDSCGADLLRPTAAAAAAARRRRARASRPRRGTSAAAPTRTTRARRAPRVAPAPTSTGLDYNFTRHSLLDEYASTLVSAFRVMHYSGDADPCVPHVGTQRWIASLALPEVEAWHPWTAPGTMPVSGYATRYVPNFTFATVRDAGHMAPRYKPRELLYLFDSWLRRAPA
ncbi:serine-type carboxypeptidase [Aureococcus anophagefferens]|uniref:Carboxypeptidase n=1 Tax=Aureococcus anophagefferens TaxID=44056 RepID=A0ABR1FW96_AURAN